MSELSIRHQLEDETHKLECLKCNLDVLALGMTQDTMGEDKMAVEFCAAMLETIYERINTLVWSKEGKEELES